MTFGRYWFIVSVFGLFYIKPKISKIFHTENLVSWLFIIPAQGRNNTWRSCWLGFGWRPGVFFTRFAESDNANSHKQNMLGKVQGTGAQHPGCRLAHKPHHNWAHVLCRFGVSLLQCFVFFSVCENIVNTQPSVMFPWKFLHQFSYKA